MTKKELCDCIVAVARSPSEDEQVNKMVMDLIEQYIKDDREALLHKLPAVGAQERFGFKPGEARKTLLKVLNENQAGPLSMDQIATALYGSCEHRFHDTARKRVEGLVNTGHIKRTGNRTDGLRYEITSTGIALHVALAAQSDNTEDLEP